MHGQSFDTLYKKCKKQKGAGVFFRRQAPIASVLKQNRCGIENKGIDGFMLYTQGGMAQGLLKNRGMAGFFLQAARARKAKH